MEFSVTVDGLQESNAYLRALWAQFRTSFGSLAWQYLPRRDGGDRTIHFGSATLGDKFGIQVSIKYGRRDTITALLIHPEPSSARLPDGVERCVEMAQERFRTPEQVCLHSVIELNKPFTFHAYSTKHLHILPSGPGRAVLRLCVRGFDRLDAWFEFHIRTVSVLDQLTVLTNCVLTLSATSAVAEHAEADGMNEHFVSEEWMFGYPLIRKRLALTERSLMTLDSLVTEEPIAETRLRRANRHFREALRLLDIDPNSSGDVATALLVSALEAASLDDCLLPNCSTCGQPRYGISKRIAELGVEHLGPGADRILKEHYNRRSRFLHSGHVLHSLPYVGSSQPLLDPDAPGGCAMRAAAARPLDLLEFAGFILRRLSDVEAKTC